MSLTLSNEHFYSFFCDAVAIIDEYETAVKDDTYSI